MDASEVDALRIAALAAFSAATDSGDLEQARIDHLGRRSPLALAQKELGGLTDEERRRVGALLNELKTAITEAFDARHLELGSIELTQRLACELAELAGC